MDTITQKLYSDAVMARNRLKSGEINYEKAKALVAPYIERANALGAKIAKKHNKKFYPFTSIGFLR